MKNMLKTVTLLAIMLLGLFCAPAVSAADLPVDINEVQIDGMELSPNAGNRLVLDRGDEVDIRVELTANEDVEDVEVQAFITGYEYNNRERMSVYSDIFDMESGESQIIRLEMPLREELDEDNYKLRVVVSDRYNTAIVQDYNLRLDAPRHEMQIEDVILNPAGTVEAGRYLLSEVTVENKGEDDEKGVKVTVSIPELEVSGSDRIKEVEYDEEETADGIYFKIPDCAQAGEYDVEVEVSFDEGYETLIDYYSINVGENPACALSADNEEVVEKTILTVGPDNVAITAGEKAKYYLTVSNAGTESKVYSLSVEGTKGWATTALYPSNVLVVEPGQTQTITLEVTADEEATAGAQMLSVSVSSEGEVLKQVFLTSTVENEAGEDDDAGLSSSVKKGIELAAIVLIVLLVILGLIIAFNKMKKDDEEDDDLDLGTSEGDGKQTYY